MISNFICLKKDQHKDFVHVKFGIKTCHFITYFYIIVTDVT